MGFDGQNRTTNAAGDVLRWTGGVVTAEGLRQSLNGQRELVVTPRTVVTPLAADHLKANGVKVVRQEEDAKSQAKVEEKSKGGWGYVLERPDPMVENVVQSLKRDGIEIQELPVSRRPPEAQPAKECESVACGLARDAAECVVRGEYLGAVFCCGNPGLVCCVANKVKGIRAVPVGLTSQAGRAVKGLGANFLGLEIGNLTFFEMRQILRTACRGPTCCSDGVAGILKELEGPCQCQPKPHGSQPVGLESQCQCGGYHAHR
jgi:ribose 5-phosphate isomerase RpiB